MAGYGSGPALNQAYNPSRVVTPDTYKPEAPIATTQPMTPPTAPTQGTMPSPGPTAPGPSSSA